jgi:hypothetical protein
MKTPRTLRDHLLDIGSKAYSTADRDACRRHRYRGR